MNDLVVTEAPTEQTDQDGVSPSGMQREEPKMSPARKALVEVWQKRVKQSEAHWEKEYKRMRRDMQFARGLQWEGQTSTDDERYVANMTQRHIAQKTAALYAKNPVAEAKRKKTLDFTIWDGDPQSYLMAQEMIATAQQAGAAIVLDPGLMQQVQQAQALIDDVQRGVARRKMLDRIGKTLEIVHSHQVGEQIPPFKIQMKQLVRRTITTGVGYVELGFHRLYERRPEDADRVTDITEQLAAMERLSSDLSDGEVQDYEAEAEELRQLLKAIQDNPDMLVREGLDYDFPGATTIVPDMNCKQLRGFLGARWVARRFLLKPSDIEEIYKVDVGKNFARYWVSGDSHGPDVLSGVDTQRDVEDQDFACVYRIYDKTTGLVYHVCEGYPDFLVEPEAPACRLERFFPIFVLTFNDVENEYNIFPPSDVELLRHMQMDHNVSRQRLREHRDANRPKHVTSKGKLDIEDKGKISGSSAHDVIELNGLNPGDRIENILQAMPHNPIDPNLYETSSTFEDMLRVGGSQEANLGGTAGATATETSIAEASRMSSIGSNVDDLDDFLTDIAKSSGHVMLYELSVETVKEIAGPGAVWPEWSKEDIARDLWLEIRAGSSGKPNRVQEIQNFERMAPFLIQIPGVSPKWLAEQAIERMDDKLDITDAFIEGLPSITSMNTASQLPTGNPATDPSQQGPRGQGNSPRVRTDANQGPNNAASGAPALNSGAPRTAAGSAAVMANI
jgi:hypothetical protein